MTSYLFFFAQFYIPKYKNDLVIIILLVLKSNELSET